MQIELVNEPVGTLQTYRCSGVTTDRLHKMAAFSGQTFHKRYMSAVMATSVIMVAAKTTYSCRVLLLSPRTLLEDQVSENSLSLRLVEISKRIHDR